MRSLAEDAMDTLASDTSCGHHAWGYPWDTQTRWSHYKAGSPNIIATAFAASALAEAADKLNQPKWLHRAENAAKWVVQELYLPAHGYFAYHQHSEQLIHNANLLGAALVHRLVAEDGEARRAVETALDHTLTAQHADGTWPYGEGDSLRWVDSFHTAYVLDALSRLRHVDDRTLPAIQRGTETYLTHFFGAHGQARLWRAKPFPQDSHSAGTALSVLTHLNAADLIQNVDFISVLAGRTVACLVDRKTGHAIFRRYRWGRSYVQYPRWCDAPVARGLALAANHLDPRKT